jgi:hypothetical protein
VRQPGARRGSRDYNPTALEIQAVAASKRIPPPYKALLICHAYIGKDFTGGRARLSSAELDDVEVDPDTGAVRIFGSALHPWAARYLAAYLTGWRKDIDSPWLFPGARQRQIHANDKKACVYFTAISNGKG